MTPKNLLVFCLLTIAAHAGALYQPELDQPQEQVMQEIAPVQAQRSARERICTPTCLRATRMCCFYGSMYLFYRNVLGLPQPAPEVATLAIGLIQYPPERLARAGIAANQAALRAGRGLTYRTESHGL